VDYVSLFTGIDAVSVAWKDLDWKAVAFSEIEKFPNEVLAHHYPQVPNLGDVTEVNWDEWRGKAELVVGGSPCQSFSVAGQRLGMDDPRGNLALHFLRVVNAIRPRWFLFENVPGLLSSDKGRDFGIFLGEVAKIGYGFAYRVLDAQYFGVAQRRRRVFVVGHIGGDWRSAASVLFERESLCRDFTKGNQKEESASTDFGISPDESWGSLAFDRKSIVGHNTTFAVRTANTQANGIGVAEEVTHTLDGVQGQAISQSVSTKAFKFDSLSSNSMKSNNPHSGLNEVDVSMTIDCFDPSPAKNQEGLAIVQPVLAPTLTASNDPSRSPQSSEITKQISAVFDSQMVVRRLTPIECERLQGFPDNYTRIPYRGKPAEKCPDGPRYKALGNSMAVPVMRWIADRIIMAEEILEDIENRPDALSVQQKTLESFGFGWDFD
jgi:DNA (cytosine-5)-methyltransferase 1